MGETSFFKLELLNTVGIESRGGVEKERESLGFGDFAKGRCRGGEKLGNIQTLLYSCMIKSN